MKVPSPKLLTPIYVRTDRETSWPEDERVFYMLGSNGLFLCRNHEFFRSCVATDRFPSELAEQKSFLQLSYPKVPRRLLELIVGFFARVGDAHGSEAGVLLAWDRKSQKIRVIIPDQVATVSTSWRGYVYPVGLHYKVPTDLPPAWVVIGDVHSHVDEAAYASGTDKHDEKHRAGLHIVVGRLYREPPEFHVEGVVDGNRFEVPHQLIFEGYRKRRAGVPEEWMKHVKVESFATYESSSFKGGGYSSTGMIPRTAARGCQRSGANARGREDSTPGQSPIQAVNSAGGAGMRPPDQLGSREGANGVETRKGGEKNHGQ